MDAAALDARVGRLETLVRQLQEEVGKRGVAIVTWGGAVYADVTVPHGLGRVPKEAWVSANSPFGGYGYAALTNGADDTNLFIRLVGVAGTTPGAGTQTPVSWRVV